MIAPIPDFVNGAFEFLGAFAVWANVVVLSRDKHVRGVSCLTQVFFTLWGIWNIYYYPHLEQWVSFLGGFQLAVANVVWLGLSLYYSRQSVIASVHAAEEIESERDSPSDSRGERDIEFCSVCGFSYFIGDGCPFSPAHLANLASRHHSPPLPSTK